jgi:hypothetical protein
MSPQPSVTQIRLNNITTCLTATVETVQILASSLNTPFLVAISNTTQSLLKNVQVNSTVYIMTTRFNQLSQTIKKNKNTCTELLEQTYQLLNAVLMVHVKLDTSGELPPSMLSHIGKFTEYVAWPTRLLLDKLTIVIRTLHKVHTFVEAQQNSNKVKRIFRQGEMSTLLKDCKAGLQQGFVIFQVGQLLNIPTTDYGCKYVA